MTPSEALALRTQTFECFIRQARKHASYLNTHASEFVRGGGACEQSVLADAPLYVWRQDLLNASLAAAATVPSPVTLSTELMPSVSGLYIFDKAVSFPGSMKQVRAIGWFSLATDYVMVYLYKESDEAKWLMWGPIISFANFILKQGTDVDVTKAEDKRENEIARAEFDSEQGSAKAVRFLLASWLWLKQRVMTTAITSANSAARKQADRAKIDSAVNVVVLRRSEGNHRTGEQDDREYSCQWFVRGHWRQQYYPSKHEHRPLWIESYVKGPDDKPFKAPTETVFSVNR